MKHRTIWYRNADFHKETDCPSLNAAMREIDKTITQIHHGLMGIGTFEGMIYEITGDGIYEKNVYTTGPITIPRKITETA